MRHLIAVITLALSLISGSAHAERVRNDEFGLSVEVPPGMRVCGYSEWQHPHGIVLALIDRPDGCDDAPDRPMITVLGWYNTVFVPSLAALGKRSCSHVTGERVPPPDLRLPGTPSIVCRVNAPDRVTIELEAQSRSRMQGDYSLVPSINYTVTLHTSPERLEADLARFRALLPTIRFHMPR